MNSIESRMHLLDNTDEQAQSVSTALNSKQSKFLKRYFKFQSYFIKKIQKDNLMKEGYLILMPKKGSGNDNMYVVLSKNVIYVVRNSVNIFKFRIVKDRLLLEYAIYPSISFSGCNINTYRKFFGLLFAMFRCVLDMPSQFVVSTKMGVTKKDFENLVRFSQIDKYL